MIIVVEGPDNVGKTTLGLWLAKELRAVYVKVERPKRAVDLVAYQHFLETANSYSGWVVADRHVAISEPIYGPICRGGHDLKDSDLEMCLARLAAIIYCRPPTARIMSTLAERPQMEGVVQNTSAIIDAYDRWWLKTIDENYMRPFRFLSQFDFTSTSAEYCRRKLVEELKIFATARDL